MGRMDARIVVAGRSSARPVLWADDLVAAGLNVTALESGPDLLRLLGVLEPDAILLDLDLPGPISALEVCRSLRVHSDSVVMFVAERPSDMEECVALGVGADHYLSERRETSVVLANLAALIRRRRGGLLPAWVDHAASDRPGGDRNGSGPVLGSQRLIDGAIDLDVTKRVVSVDGTPIALTRTEFDLLELMLRNPRQVFSHPQLLDAIGIHHHGSSQLLRAHLSRLRRKLAAAGGGRVAHAVHGVGYRLRP